MTGQPLRYAWVAAILYFLAMWKAVYVVLRNHSAFPQLPAKPPNFNRAFGHRISDGPVTVIAGPVTCKWTSNKWRCRDTPSNSRRLRRTVGSSRFAPPRRSRPRPAQRRRLSRRRHGRDGHLSAVSHRCRGAPKRYPLNDYYRTPNMERLAKRGIRFNNFYAMSVCSPTRISIMTGQNAARHRATNWINPDKDNRGPFGPPDGTGAG